jgi:hypothetical protein
MARQHSRTLDDVLQAGSPFDELVDVGREPVARRLGVRPVSIEMSAGRVLP